ncbi:MAG: hypothetical protein ACKV2Q_28055 [Planctomycetaceae bacterium]
MRFLKLQQKLPTFVLPEHFSAMFKACEVATILTASFNPLVFPWNYNRRTLWTEFAHIQEAARIADKSPMPKAGKDGR